MSIKISTGKKGKKGWFSSFAGGIICLMLALIGFYAVLFDGNISGGIPFIPESANQIFGKAFILIGAIFTGVLAIIAFKEFFEYGRYQKKK